MEKKKQILCAVGAVLLAASLILILFTRTAAIEANGEMKSTMSQSKELDKALEEKRKTVEELQSGEAAAQELEQAEAELAQLRSDAEKAEQKAAAAKSQGVSRVLPFAAGLIGAVLGLVTVAAGIFLRERESQGTLSHVRNLTMCALFAALSFVGFEYFRIDIPVGAGSTAFHLGNVFCALGALLLGGLRGGLAGAIGLTIADLTLPQYMIGAPKTFVLKLCIGLITGLFAHKVFRVSRDGDRRIPLPAAVVLSTAAGLVFNIAADPAAGYFYKRFVLGAPAEAAKVWAKFNAVTTCVNAVVAVAAASVLYLALRPALKKARLLPNV